MNTHHGKAFDTTCRRRIVWAIALGAVLLGNSVSMAQWKLGVLITDEDPRPQVPGITIVRVHPGGPAGRMGLEPGDVVYAVNGVAVCTIFDMQRAIATSPGQARLTEAVCS